MGDAKLQGPWRFRLRRNDDVTGVSGTGYVADGVRFGDGTHVLRWRTSHRSTAIYASGEDVVAIHGHDGKTALEWIDDPPSDAFLRGAQDAIQDSYEGCPGGSIGATKMPPAWIHPDDRAEYLRGYDAAQEPTPRRWGR